MNCVGKKEIRVLQVISNFGIGGAETWLISLLRYFKEYEEDLAVKVKTDVFLTHAIGDKLDGEAQRMGARLIHAPYSRKTLPSFIAEWRKTLKEGEYDAIHDHQEFTAGWHFFFGLGALPRVRIAHLHNPMGHQERYASSWIRSRTLAMGNRLIGSGATHLLSTSRALIEEQGFNDMRAARSLKKMAVYCGFDAGRFRGEQSVVRADIRSEFDFPESAKILLFVGRLDSHPDESKNMKNPGFCLEVAKACAAKDPNFFCIMAGGGKEMQEKLEERVRSWGLEKRIRLLGPRSDVPQLMLAADLLLFPSLAEGLGMVAVEAQSAGLRVLASDAVPEECAVVEGMVKFLPLSAGLDRWVGVATQMMAEPKPNAEMANNKVGASPFSIKHSAETLLDIYRGNA